MKKTTAMVQQFFDESKVSLSFHYPKEETLLIVNTILTKILSRFDQLFLIDSTVTVIREIILNATKANYKRIFFEKRGLNILSPEDYTKGIGDFRESINDQKNIEQELNSSNYEINFNLQKNEKDFTVCINHNIQITNEELSRIKKRIELGATIEDFTDAYSAVYDTTEGAGLGIVLAVLLIKNAGIPPKNFTVNKKDNSLEFKIIVPQKIQKVAVVTKIKDTIIKAIDALPTIPQKIIDLQQMCNNKNIKIEEIAETHLLKVYNFLRNGR
jgi:hypothetical protein